MSTIQLTFADQSIAHILKDLIYKYGCVPTDDPRVYLLDISAVTPERRFLYCSEIVGAFVRHFEAILPSPEERKLPPRYELNEMGLFVFMILTVIPPEFDKLIGSIHGFVEEVFLEVLRPSCLKEIESCLDKIGGWTQMDGKNNVFRTTFHYVTGKSPLKQRNEFIDKQLELIEDSKCYIPLGNDSTDSALKISCRGIVKATT